MNWSERRARFRAVLAGPACVYPGSVHDPVSARIAEDLGFEVGMFAGSTGSLAVLGAPDLIVLTLTEFAQQALRINRAARTLPLMVDADHGYGNALNVKRTVEELETAGVAGLTIEDTLLPVPYGASGKTQLITIEEGVGKMRAALAGRQDPALTIVARTSAMQLAGEAETIMRARAYAATGVDALFLVGVATRAQLDAVAASVQLPLMLGTMPAALADREYLAARGVRLALQGHLPFDAAIRAIHDTLKALRNGTNPADIAGIASGDLVKQVTRDAEYRRWMKEFLG
ncbi:MAG: isocitrate lyase/PEP mutase family protein [Pseudomonadota bacterium]|nr:isocitrate lyase/PEP mutase family protein [Pseudomonadota bacterium]